MAEIDGRVVGTVQFALHEKHVHLVGLAVHPDYQNRGIARSMIAWVAHRTPRFGHKTLVVDTIRETGNIALFEKMGFHVVRETVANWCESDDYPELHDVTMERSLG